MDGLWVKIRNFILLLVRQMHFDPIILSGDLAVKPHRLRWSLSFLFAIRTFHRLPTVRATRILTEHKQSRPTVALDHAQHKSFFHALILQERASPGGGAQGPDKRPCWYWAELFRLIHKPGLSKPECPHDSTTRKPKPGFTRGSARCYLRGRCFSEIERMISLPLPALANGGSACASAASSNS
jgi:hypothetical protein